MLMQRIGFRPNLCVCVCITTDAMFNFDVDTNVNCEQSIKENRVKQCELILLSLPAKMCQSHSLTVRPD